jgi:propanediol dehydratase small subunit
MTKHTIADYPLAETQPDKVIGKRGLSLPDVTLDAVIAGTVTMADLRITPRALLAQAEIARDANRNSLALNFERAAELVDVPQDIIMQIYELLRPGRAKSKAELLDTADMLRNKYNANRMADFVAEAAEIYERRNLFKSRY